MVRQPSEYPPIMDTAMVGELLQMSPVHVRRLAREGVIPAYRIEGVRAFKFKRDEVLNWFEAQRVEMLEEVRSAPMISVGAPSTGSGDHNGDDYS